MSWLKTFAHLIGENPEDIRKRGQNLADILTGSVPASSGSRQQGPVLSGRIILFVTRGQSKGEEDFNLVLKRNNRRVTRTIRINARQHGAQALARALETHKDQYKRGDILVIVRGGGDTEDRQFAPYRDEKSCKAIRWLVDNMGVIVVTGIGHASDRFAVEVVATYPQATPTDAAYKVCELLESRR